MKVQYGFCKCGCNQKTNVMKRSEKGRGWIRGKYFRFLRGHNNKGKKKWNWGGDKIHYVTLHNWVRRNLGSPSLCSVCGTTKAKGFEWANISKEYKRSNGLEDWKRLCIKCHRQFDEFYKNHINSKLTEKKIIKIRKLYSSGNLTTKDLGEKFKVSDSNIGYIVRYKTWKYIKPSNGEK